MSAVDNITDTYRAALRATYCSTGTDENRFSYRTVDSDHSLLHTMRQDGEWLINKNNNIRKYLLNNDLK